MWGVGCRHAFEGLQLGVRGRAECSTASSDFPANLGTPVRLGSYRDLEVWKKSVELVVASYRVAGVLPHSELYGLVSQIRRAGTSVPANIAEGYGQLYRASYIRHLSIAQGSLKELETHFHISERLGYVRAPDLAEVSQLCDEVGRMLASLVRSLQRRA